jgi:hypothetical protein
LPQSLNNLRLEHGDANFDIRHRFAASVIWDLPFYANNRSRLGRLLGGWQIAGIFQAQTGQPFTLTLPFDNNLDGNLSDRPANTTGLITINQHGRDRVKLDSSRDFQDYLDLQPMAPGVIGCNTARGDSAISLDLSLNKIFSFTERQKLTFRTEFFNLLNRANFGLPIGVIGAPGFGSAVETTIPA